ncbi:FRG domain-containing protein [Clavibacter sp. km1a]|uniref:FRG domain-containing protein n=1 Tax=Clavibacter sp. km1a TaxID=3459136 RepID=UPI004041D6E2
MKDQTTPADDTADVDPDSPHPHPPSKPEPVTPPTKAPIRDIALPADASTVSSVEQIKALGARVADLHAGAPVGDLMKQMSAQTKLDVGAFMAKVFESQGSMLAAALADSWPTLVPLSNPALFSEPEPPQSPYSPYMKKVSDFFTGYEGIIDSVTDLNRFIANVVTNSPSLQLVWRGQQSVEWGIHSSLFRALRNQNGVLAPEDSPEGDQPFPSEDQMVAAEELILDAARSQWRFDGTSALETFARIQHAGGLTRLLDVTFNPYIAAWFATEEHEIHDNRDGRLVAFATAPLSKEGMPSSPSSRIDLDLVWGGRQPFWHTFQTSKERQGIDWGTGSRRRLWVPPAYDPRIAAQNAAFLLDGIPITSSKTAPYFHVRGGRSKYFKRADLLAAGSILMRTVPPQQKPRYNKQNMAPTFPFRITARAKPKIRRHLESTFGYSRASLYPDMTALAQYVSGMKLPPLA